jgi:hypothetical protein
MGIQIEEIRIRGDQGTVDKLTLSCANLFVSAYKNSSLVFTL